MGVGSHKVMGKGYVNTENNQMASIGAMFNYTYHTKQPNLWSSSPASHMVIYSWLPGSPEMISHLKTIQPFVDIWQASETSHSIEAVWLTFSTNACLNIFSECIQLLCDGEKCVLLLYAWKTVFSQTQSQIVWWHTIECCGSNCSHFCARITSFYRAGSSN